MSEKKEHKKALPPYMPWKTLCTFLESLKIALPQRIDRSLMKSMSGGMQSSLMATLEYLNLISPNTGITTEKLNQLIQSEGEEKKGKLKEILTSSYPFLFEDGFNLERATGHEFRERFERTGATGDTLRKCIAFFMKAAKDADLKLSPYLKKIPGLRAGASKPKRKKNVSQEHQESLSTTSRAETPPASEDFSLEKILLSKFPDFNPEWSPEVQSKWFDGFDKLMDRIKKKQEE